MLELAEIENANILDDKSNDFTEKQSFEQQSKEDMAEEVSLHLTSDTHSGSADRE
jgi:hypothetical protein